MKIAEYLRDHRIHAEAAIDEGLSILVGAATPAKDRSVALVGLAQKGYVSLRLSASTPGGHAMTPPIDHSTTIEQLACAITTLAKHQVAFTLDPAVDARTG